MNWKRGPDGMLIEQEGAGTLTVMTISSDVETWVIDDDDGVGWVKQADGTLDVIMRSSLSVQFGEFNIVASFGPGTWQCIRWEAEDGNHESEARP